MQSFTNQSPYYPPKWRSRSRAQEEKKNNLNDPSISRVSHFFYNENGAPWFSAHCPSTITSKRTQAHWPTHTCPKMQLQQVTVNTTHHTLFSGPSPPNGRSLWTNEVDPTPVIKPSNNLKSNLIIKPIILVVWILIHILLVLLWRIIFQVHFKGLGECDRSKNTHNWRQGQHQSDHHTSKVAGKNGIQHNWKTEGSVIIHNTRTKQ